MQTKLTREDAIALLSKYNKEPFHILHGLTVGGVLKWYANELGYGDEAGFWEICGILHDIDFEEYPEEHCLIAPRLLKEGGAEDEVIHAVCSHGYGIHEWIDAKPEHEMEKVLFAADELTGLIGAAARMRPSKSVQDMEVSSLKKKYQGTVDEDGRYHEGASTLISRAKSETSVTKRQGSPKIDEKTGEYIWKDVDDPVYVDKRTGKVKERTQPSTKMAEAKDAYTLVSEADTPVERAYANYANKMKALGNQARLEILSTGKVPYSATAKETYQAEVDSLNAKLNVALKNAPRERQAQTMANAVVAAKKQDNPDMTKGELKKASQQALTQARASVGAKRETIKITDREWEAIQAGAISENKLTQIIDNVDIDSLRQRATPRATTTLSTAKQNKIASMNASGYSTSEIAEALGISTSTVSNYLN